MREHNAMYPSYIPTVSPKELKPGRGWYVMAGLVFVFSIALGVGALVAALVSLPDVGTKFDDGEPTIVQLDAKEYTIYAKNADTFSFSDTCTVVSDSTGDEISLDGTSTTYTKDNWEAIFHFDIEREGKYQITCHEASVDNQYAVGERANLWGFSAGIVAIFALPGLGLLIGGIIAVVVAVKRNSHKSRLRYQRHYEHFTGATGSS